MMDFDEMDDHDYLIGMFDIPFFAVNQIAHGFAQAAPLHVFSSIPQGLE